MRDSVSLRIRGFAQQFRGDELDIHFFLSKDLTPPRQFLQVLRDQGMTKVTTLMERGDFGPRIALPPPHTARPSRGADRPGASH
jgi:hypothetical protein